MILFNGLTFIIFIKQKDNEKGAAVNVVVVPEASTSSEKNDKKSKPVNSR